MLKRREFVKGGLAAAGLGLFGGATSLFAAPPGWKPKKKPNLVFGVMSDTHMRCHYDGVRFYDHNGWCYGDHAVVEALKCFRKENADAVLHCGDLTDCGMVREMEFYKEAFDKVYGAEPRPVNMIVMGNHDIFGGDEWAMGVAKSKDPKVYKKLRLGAHNLSREMERIWGEHYENIWHRTVKGYHFFGFGWPRFTGEDMNEATPYEGTLYRDTPYEGKNYVQYVHSGLKMAELVRREREAGRLDPQKPFFTATHALWHPMSIVNNALRTALGLKESDLCNGLGLFGHGHGSNAHFGFNWCGDTFCYPHLMCSTLAYWKSHGGENDEPLFAKGFGSGRLDVKDLDRQKSNHALIVKVYDDMMTIGRIWVDVLPKLAVGSLGPDWVMPLSGFTPENHPFKKEEYAKVIGSPEFQKDAKLGVSFSKETGLCIKIPKANGNRQTRVYGYNVVVVGEGGEKLKKNAYARGYCMGEGFEPDGGVTTVEIAESELPRGKNLTVAVKPCSSLATRGKALVAVLNTTTGSVKHRKANV